MTKMTPSEEIVQASTTANEDRPVRAATYGLPAKQGLYDPKNEHDACGVGFIAHMKGRKSHQIVKDGPVHPGEPDPPWRRRCRSPDGRWRRHPGADPGPLLPRGNGQAGHHTAEGWRICRRSFLLPAGRDADRALQEDHRRGLSGRGPGVDRLSRRAGRQFLAVEGAGHCRDRAAPYPGLHRRRPRCGDAGDLRAPAVPAAQGHFQPHL